MKKRKPSPPEGGPDASHDYARGARPLSRDVARIAPPKRAAPSLASKQTTLPSSEKAPIFETSDDGLVIEGSRPGYQRAVRELRRGQWPLFDSLDLHGLTVLQAERAVRRFCAQARGPEPRALLVVHGRGSHSPQNRGVLRDEIAVWLTTVPLASMILAFVTARPRDGGWGALYVLLAGVRGRRGG